MTGLLGYIKPRQQTELERVPLYRPAERGRPSSFPPPRIRLQFKSKESFAPRNLSLQGISFQGICCGYRDVRIPRKQRSLPERCNYIDAYRLYIIYYTIIDYLASMCAALSRCQATAPAARHATLSKPKKARTHNIYYIYNAIGCCAKPRHVRSCILGHA
jgi:hypothetical protein